MIRKKIKPAETGTPARKAQLESEIARLRREAEDAHGDRKTYEGKMREMMALIEEYETFYND
jgi:hypothetical protein